MARKILNRKELREENDAAERSGGKKKPAAKKPAVKRKSRAKVAKEVRLKAFWGVFSQSLKRSRAVRAQPAGGSRQKGRRPERIAKESAFCPTRKGSHRGVIVL